MNTVLFLIAAICGSILLALAFYEAGKLFNKLLLRVLNCHMCKQNKKGRMTWDFDLEEKRPICHDCGESEVRAGNARYITKGQSPLFCDRTGSGRTSHALRLS